MATLRRITRLWSKTGRFWTDAYVLYLGARDSRVPLYGRIAAAGFALYVLSPIEIVPDPIPFIGVVDDFLVIPVGLWFIRKLVPEHLRREHEMLAIERQPQRPGFSEAFGLMANVVKRVPSPEAIGPVGRGRTTLDQLPSIRPVTTLRQRVSRRRRW